ncbi:MAG TPA: rhodanese-like domain-containing protein [Syntrophorhabdaceae bacterium]|nr:rhodanese-like domain-containing protein [Syntrophorhabdaceae bacterium]
MRIVRGFFFILLFIFALSCRLAYANDIEAEELKKMMSRDTKLVVVDTRTEYEYSLGHIPGAINISQEKFRMLDALLPKEKDRPLVFYCRGVG